MSNSKLNSGEQGLYNDAKEKEILYYKRQVNELGATIIRLEYHVAEMSHEIQQARQGFSLMSGLRDKYWNTTDFDEIYEYFSEEINKQMSMDRSMILHPDDHERGIFVPDHIKGYSASQILLLEKTRIRFPQEFLVGKDSLLVNSQTKSTQFIEELRNHFLLPYFILTPVVFQEKIISFLFAGRKFEIQHLATSRLLIHNLSILEAIAGIITTIKTQYEQYRLIENERTRIARELHDDIGAELTKITLLSQLLEKKFRDDTDAATRLHKITDSGKKVLTGISEIIWTINGQNDNLQSLMAYIRRHITELLAMREISCDIFFPDDIPSLYIGDEIRRNIFLVIKEAVNNSVKYSGSAHIVLRCEFKLNMLSFSISDDGCGFDIGLKDNWGNGLVNMQQRIQEIGGSFRIRTAVGDGTSVHFDLKISS